MPRFLKTNGTCLTCGGEAPIRSLRKAEHVRCEQCREFIRLLSCARYREESSAKQRKAAPQNAGASEAALYLRSAASRLEAAAYVLEAYAHGMKGMSPAEERRWLSWAKGRAEWAVKMAENTLPLVARERNAAALGLVALPGDRALPPAPTPHVALRIVGLGLDMEE